jgi:hypothetical protein
VLNAQQILNAWTDGGDDIHKGYIHSIGPRFQGVMGVKHTTFNSMPGVLNWSMPEVWPSKGRPNLGLLCPA